MIGNQHKEIQSQNNAQDYDKSSIQVSFNSQYLTKLNSRKRKSLGKNGDSSDHNDCRPASDTFQGLKSTKRIRRKNLQWTPEEDATLFNMFAEHGSKWVKLSQHLPDKSDNDIKNRFYCCIRKVQKIINIVQKQRNIKQKKLIGFDSLLTVLEIGKFGSNQNDKRFQQINKNVDIIMQSRKLIIELAKKPQHEFDYEKVQQLILKLLDSKYSLKFINIRRVKRSAQKQVVSQHRSIQQVQCSSIQQQKNAKSSQRLQIKQKPNECEILTDDSLFDIQNISQQFIKNLGSKKNESLFETCKDVLGSSLLGKQKNDEFFFLL